MTVQLPDPASQSAGGGGGGSAGEPGALGEPPGEPPRDPWAEGAPPELALPRLPTLGLPSSSISLNTHNHTGALGPRA